MPYNQYSDQQLTGLLASGDEQAFTVLYRRYSAAMYYNLLKMVKDESLAEEMVQDIFTTIWQKRERLRVEQNFSGYLYRMGRNLVLDFYRKLQRDNKLREHFKALACRHYVHVEEALQLRESQKQLQQALAVLSPRQKKVYQLCKLDGFSYKEAARILGISPHTVKEYLVKANQLVRKRLLSDPDLAVSLLLIAFTGAVH